MSIATVYGRLFRSLLLRYNALYKYPNVHHHFSGGWTLKPRWLEWLVNDALLAAVNMEMPVHRIHGNQSETPAHVRVYSYQPGHIHDQFHSLQLIIFHALMIMFIPLNLPGVSYLSSSLASHFVATLGQPMRCSICSHAAHIAVPSQHAWTVAISLIRLSTFDFVNHVVFPQSHLRVTETVLHHILNMGQMRFVMPTHECTVTPLLGYLI